MSSWTVRLLVANVLVFLLTSSSPETQALLRLVPAELPAAPWTLLTYMFVHAGFGHIFFNMFALFIFGPRLEARIGGGHFLALYLLSGIMGGLLSFTAPLTPIVGASGAIFGVQLGFASFWPKDRIYIWGVLPIEARWLVIIMTGIELFSGVTGSRDGVAHFAHLGGFLGGFLYLRWLARRAPGGRLRSTATESPEPPRPAVAPDRGSIERWESIRGETLHEVNRHELERIRQKLATDGVGSLTPGDREFLDRFSAGAS